jgi:hypothetical protein
MTPKPKKATDVAVDAEGLEEVTFIKIKSA